MAALEAGKPAPPFSLPLVSGENFSLAEALRKGPVVLAFFKVSCPVCQFAFPYIDRIYNGAKGKNVTVVGISQNKKHETEAFAREFRLGLPIALDDQRSYAASNAYGLTNVPSIFYISKDGEIE